MSLSLGFFFSYKMNMLIPMPLQDCFKDSEEDTVGGVSDTSILYAPSMVPATQ